MKELQNFVYRHMDALRHHKRYLAMLTALSMLVTFIVPLILMEPADSMTGILVCNKTVHTHNAECYVGDTLICDIEEHIHTNECYKKFSTVSLKGTSSSGTPHSDNIAVPNAGGGQDDNGNYVSADAHPVVGGSEGEYYNPSTLSLYTLLFGEGADHWVNPAKSLEENLEIVDDEYFLGFASDFCAFIESDFIAFDADAEGRMFVGGDLIFNGNPQVGEWNYQVGAGDYGHFIPISQTDEYRGISGFASGIIGGKVYRLGTITTGSTDTVSKGFKLDLPSGRPERHTKGYDIFLYPEEGAYKRFIVGNLKDSLHLDEDYLTHGDGVTKDIPYNNGCNHLYFDVSCSYCGNGNTNHDYLGEVNELSQFYRYTDVSTILEKTFDTIRARSLSLSSVNATDVTSNGGALTLDASNIGDAKTVYFKLDNWDGISNIEIKIPHDRIKKIENSIYTNNEATITELDLNVIVSCDDESITINGAKTYFVDAQEGTRYEISNRNANATNNHPLSSNILYNFYNATSVEFSGDCNFNGTIMAPNANVTSPEKCPGHLSGALIAKSFYGGLEFGYRPYRGGTDIFGMASGYAIPVDKLDEDNVDKNGNKLPLPGALFAIKQDGKFVSLFESGYGTNFAQLPSRVDFTGNTRYEQDAVNQQSDVDKSYAGSTVIGEKLTAPVEIALYKDSSCNESINSGSTLDNVYTKLYLKANQDVNIDSNENYVVTGPDNGVYTITLIKPAEEIEITARNQGDSEVNQSVSVKFTSKMTLEVDSKDKDPQGNYKKDKEITLTANNYPVGNEVYYKYFSNGTEISDYVNTTNYTYTPTAAGYYTFSVKAYTKVGDKYYEISQATANQITIKEPGIPEDLSITLSGNTLSNANGYTITSGNDLTVQVSSSKMEDLNGATIEYAFYNSGYSTTNVFTTQNIVGKDLVVKVRVTKGDKTVELYETITVNFKGDIKFNDYSTQYEVNSNDKFYFSLQNVPNGATVTYYFNGKAYSSSEVPKTVVGTDIPVYAIVSANGLETKIVGTPVTGKYNQQLALNVESGPFIVGEDIIDLDVKFAPNDAKVVFRAFDSNGNVVWTSDEKNTTNGGCSASFTPDKSGSYTFKAYMTYEGNPTVELQGSTVTVNAKPVNGELQINPNQVNVGSEVELKVYAATIGANVVFTLRDQYGNTVKTFNGTTDSNGECRITYTPDQAGSYSVHALITKDGAERQVQQSLTVRENTTVLTGNFTVQSSGNRATVNISNASNGAVVNIYVTRPDGQTQHQSGNINNSTYSWDFDTNADGVYKVRVTLVQNGTTLDLGEQSFTVGSVDYTGTIEVECNSSQPFTPNDNFVAKFNTNAPNGTNVELGIYYYYETNQLLTQTVQVNDGQCSVTYNPQNKGDLLIIARINGVKIAEYTVRINALFTLDKQQYESGSEAVITVSEVDNDETIGEVQTFTIGGNNVTDYTIDGKTLKFTTPSEAGEHELYLKVKLSKGVITEYRTTIKNVELTVASYAFRRYLSILADEEIVPYSDDNLIEITAPENERIGSVRLVFPSDIDASKAKFTIKATLNGEENNTRTYTNNNVQNNEIVISESNVTKIEITPVAGSITIDKCYPTYVKKENKVTQTFNQDFTLKQYEEREIVLGDWVETLDSITINLDETTNANDGDIYYALIPESNEGSTAATEFIKATVSNNKIEITGINAENIDKIKIYTTKSTLTFKDYTISAYVGEKSYSDDELNALKTATQDITSVYTLVEQQAPIGYFKENTVYIVEVKETINLNELVSPNEATYPSVVDTTVTVKDTEGNIVLTYKLRISYPKTDSGINVNERTVQFLDEEGNVTDTFTLTRGTDGNGKDTLTVKDSSGNVLDWNTTTPKQYGNYYFDPNAMMVVPVSENPIEYTNKMGLLFRKIDDKGASVKGVTIELYEGNEKVTDTSLWYWDANSSEWLIDFKKLPLPTEENPSPVYRITETYAGGKYELAEDIYFQRTGEEEVTYWTGSNTMPEEENKVTVLNFAQSLETRVIRMENTRVTGLKIQLRKTDIKDGTVIGTDDNFAKFSLYAADGTELLQNIGVVKGQVELDFSGFDKNNTTYVENGYLKPGTYYLKELSAPNGYEASTKNFYFNIVQTSDGSFQLTSSEILPGITLTEETQDNGDVHRVTRVKADALQQISDGLTAETINASTPIIQFKFKTDSGQTGWGNAKFTAIINGKIKTPNKTKFPSGCNYHADSGGMSFQNTDVTVEFTVQQLCELFDISVSDFNTINEFVISTWNKTDVKDFDFWVIKNPINSGDNGSGGGESGGNAGDNDSSGQSIRDVMFCANPNDTNYKVKKMTFYLSNGETSSIDNPSISTVSNYNHLISLPEKTQNVIAVVIEVEGNGNDKLKVVNTAGEKIWGDLKDQYDHDALYTEINGNGTYIIPKTFDPSKPVETTSTATTSSTTTTTTVATESTTTTTAKAIPMLTIDKNILIVPNEALGVEMDLRVDKKWVGDEGATEFRKPVNVVLKQKTGEDGTYVTFKPTGQEQDYITLDTSNNWSYTWKDLPRYENGPNDEGDDVLYYYKVDEVTSVTGYTSSVPNVNINEGGIIEITNTADTVNIPVEKSWNSNGNGDVSAILPETLKVKLQAKIGDNWTDIPGKTLTLTAANKQEGDKEEIQLWKGTFENLPKGYDYRIVEVDVPFGWQVTYTKKEITAEETNSITNQKFELTNKYVIKTGSIAIQKLWQDLTGESALPYSITVDLYRSVIAPSYTETDAPFTDNANGNGQTVDYKQDYARLLQHSLYFYDANMCGTDVAEKSALAWRTNCHVEDEVPGGYHDAGDHVMFGLPQGYTASMLGWSYLEFIKEGNGNVDPDEMAHYKLILERFYDFFVNSVKYDSNGKISELLVQKGLGAVDHDIWCAPERQVSRADEMVWTSTSGSNVAAEYAAALALGYLNFNDGSEKYSKYLEVAEKLYEFAGRTSAFTASDNSGTYYGDGESDDDKAWAAAWLYEATQLRDGSENSTYKNGRSNKTGELQWDTVQLAAACAMARQTGDWSGVKSYIESTYTNKDYFYIHSWGTARFNAMAQTATLIAAKYNTDKKETYVNWAVGQMNKLLGGNNWKDTISGSCASGTVNNTNSAICLVTNFVPNGFDVDTPQAAHHRAASGWDTHEEYKTNCGYDDDSYALIGALVGGPAFGAHTDQPQMNAFQHNHPKSGHDYIDDLHDYCCNEVAIDYNAGLVGAAAGLYYFKGTGSPSTKIEGVEYGAYGLTAPTATGNGIESPTNSAVPEGAQTVSIDEAVNEYVLKTFAMRQTKVNVLADVHTINNVEFGTQYSVNLEGVTSITIDFIGGTINLNGCSLETNNGIIANNIAAGWAQNTTISYTKDLNSPENIEWIKLNCGWADMSNLSIKIHITYGASTGGGGNENPPAEPMTLTFNPSNTINLGDTVILGVNNPPANYNGIKYYDHNNNEINPNYQPQTAGEFTITAKAFANNDWNNPAATATGTLTVIDNSQGGGETTPILSIDKTSIKLNNEKAYLTVNPSGGNVEYFYKNNNNSTSGLSINNGNGEITPNNAGEYEIWVKRDNIESNHVMLTVKPTLSFNNNNNAEINVGETATLNPNPNPDTNQGDGYTYEGQSNGLEINGNTVKGLIAGTYTIKVRVNNVTSDSVTLTVKSVAVEGSLSITPAEYYLQTNTAYGLSISGNSGDITWSFDKEGISVNSEQKLVATKPGTYTVTGTDAAGRSVSFKVEVGDYIAKVDISNYSTNGWGDKIQVPALPTEYSSYEISRVGFKFNGRGTSGSYKFGIDNLSSQTQEYEFKNIPDILCQTINIQPTENVQLGTWYNPQSVVPTAMYLIYNKPALTITHNDQKTDEVEITEGETITLGYKYNNGDVTWQGGVNSDGSYTAPNVDTTTEYTITASDGTNEDTITIKVNPLAFTENSIMIEGFNAERTLELNSTRPLTDFNWTSSDPTYITVENGIITAKKTTTNPITITATDKSNNAISASIQVSANVPVEALTISGESTTGIGGEIVLTKSGGPHEALSYKWTSSDTSKATVDQNGKVIGIAPGEVTITLEAYSGSNQTGNVLESVEKKITIQNIRVKEVTVNKTINRTEKYLVSLEDIPTNAKIKSITVNLDGNMVSDQIVHRTYITEDWVINENHKPINDSGKTDCNITGSGSIVWDTSSFSDKIPVGQENSKYAFEIWWSNDNTTSVTITSIVIEYETDGRELNLTTDKTIIRKGENVNLTINAVRGEVAELTASPSGIVELPTTFANGDYTITSIAAGEVTITAKIDDSLTKSVKLIIKDNITINGSEVMDLNSGQTLTVNNSIGEITWGVAEGTDYTVDGDIITFANGATLNKATGVVRASTSGGEFTITATDSHDGSTSSITIGVTERPKVPELPKDTFLEKVPGTNGKVTLTAENGWKVDVSGLAMTDAKGNPYYYYIKESGYKQTANSPEKPLTDSVGHYIHSSNAVYMPVSYYNNGILPVENGEKAVAKVGNKLTKTIQGQLPSTGGSGVTTYYYLGGVIMLLSIAGFTGLKRREKKRRKE